jgi:epsilon-lactone hydrolase
MRGIGAVGDPAGENMQTATQQNRETDRIWHPISQEEKAAMTAMRAVVKPNKGHLRGTAARGPFDSIMSRVVAHVE